MTTLIFVFVLAMSLSLILTPIVRTWAIQHQLTRTPNSRDSHTAAKPRIGGIALYLSFILPLIVCLPLQTQVTLLLRNSHLLTILYGATILFVIGLCDDFQPINPYIKLAGQLCAGLITWLGGIQINTLSISLTSGIELHWLSLPVTIFWIVLVTNAINLIDGLDGLAAGVTMLASLLMILVCIIGHKLLLALCFTALFGSLVGFLRYNFNPASIFMGDGGSYFLGYTIASLSILGSVKGQTTLAMLIPILALGVPLFDTLFAPIRRFLQGKKIFSPDKNHLHHRLIQYGLTQKQVVLVLYGFTILLSTAAFLLTYAKDRQASLILSIPAVAIIFFLKKSGYLNYFAPNNIYNWVLDILEAAKINPSSRALLDIQLHIKNAETIEEMWKYTEKSFEMLEFDFAQLKLSPSIINLSRKSNLFQWVKSKNLTDELFNTNSTPDNTFYFSIKIPIFSKIMRNSHINNPKKAWIGCLSLKKNLAIPAQHYTLRRIGQLVKAISYRLDLEIYETRRNSASNASHELVLQ